ncbi:Wall-associated receptor kinase 2 [Acorus gramineus]|uniref:Wall-associated receptor kinase 2 n=1 Tax=Acorus gramineus TaxID=55184 RepID=A0AAV9BR82_ACOGR|nr:Wall-associated receptor kinase 2 [Acorus gramineus]
MDVVTSYIKEDCYNKQGVGASSNGVFSILLSNHSTYTFSDSQNKLIVLGCNTYAYMEDLNAAFGCISVCNNLSTVTKGSCNGIGCCQTSIPKGIKSLYFTLSSFNNHSLVNHFNMCNYAFVADQKWFTFQGLSDLSGFARWNKNTSIPQVLDWVIENQTCEAAIKTPDYACVSQNSLCYNSTNGPTGYRCNCSKGYQGNPYLQGGCQAISAAIVISMGILLISGCAIVFYERWKLGNQKKLKQKYFLHNQGLLLQHLISSDEDSPNQTKIFTIKELEKATNNFDDTRVLGCGGHGTVYKGLLSDQRIVAIKKSKIVDSGEIDQFINEVATLSRINHRNVVKLYGCCLESEVPLLVYEFIPNGMLSDHIHSEDHHLSWEDRIRIAAESAGALSYMHSAASMTIFHRDVKSSNILLDDNYQAKVADFGASRFVPHNDTHVSTAVQGTFGYLDPEYFRTGKLTEKSDVYSFGVILVELLTGKRPLSMHEDRNLSTHFILLFKENRLDDIIDDQVAKGGKEQIQMVAEITEACLRVKGEERPLMKEVAIELERLRQHNKKHLWIRIPVCHGEAKNSGSGGDGGSDGGDGGNGEEKKS